MAPFRTPANLPELVRTAFAKAKSNGDLNHIPSQATILTPYSLPFQVRFAPALAVKPTAHGPDPTRPKIKHDPFADPPAALMLCELRTSEDPELEAKASHFLVLNKFAITQGHFILATTENKPQSHLLESDDLAAAMACINAYDQEGKELFVFFNSGQHSGASQPHRHLQLLPVEEMRSDLPVESEDRVSSWDILTKSVPALSADDNNELIIEAEGWPFRAFAAAVDLKMSAKTLHQTYLALYRRACRAVDEYAESKGFAVVAEHAHDIGITDGEAWISYNLALTDTRMVICPRMRDRVDLTDREGKKAGAISLNGTLLAGTALVKSEAEWNALKADATALEGILKRVGIPGMLKVGI